MSLILSGCGGKSLSEREIVRGILFAQQTEGYSVCLVLADQGESSDENSVVAAQGSTAAQALAFAEQALSGDAYYGLLDLVVLPAECDFSSVREIGELVYQNAQPAPELSLFAIDSTLIQSWSEQGLELYQNMKDLERTYKIHCGLQQLFAQQNVCAIPIYVFGGGYDFLLFPQNAPPLRCRNLAQAQLAALLNGQTSLLRGTYALGRAFCEARAQITVDENQVQIHLRNASLSSLDSSLQEGDLPILLESELQMAFQSLYKKMREAQVDPFYLDFWQRCLYGPGSQMQNPFLEVMFES